MTFITDTHPFVHHVTGKRNRLGHRARRIFDSVKRGRDTLIVPFTVLEEVMLLSEIGRIQTSTSRSVTSSFHLAKPIISIWPSMTQRY